MLENMEIPKLTPQEIAELNKYAAQEKLAQITVLLADLDNEMFITARELGEARIKYDQQKNKKSALTEIARALAKIIQTP